jgi:hypothetical protein
VPFENFLYLQRKQWQYELLIRWPENRDAMFLAHFGLALAAKKIVSEASLGTLVFSAQLADLLWPIFCCSVGNRLASFLEIPGLPRSNLSRTRIHTA